MLFGLALLVYLLTLSPGAFPGESARLIVQHAGLDVFPPMAHLLWTPLVRVVAAVPLGSLALRLNLLSALLAAGAVGLMYWIMVRIPHNRTAEEFEARFPPAPVQTLSGIVAAVVLAFCAPFWFIATRAHVASFDIFLLLLAAALLMKFLETRRPALIYGFALLYGLGITEYSTFIVLSPAFLCVVVFAMWRTGLLRPGPVALSLLLLLAGLSVYLCSAWAYSLSPASGWRGFSSIFEVLWFMWREQYREIRFSLPQVGWLLVLMVSLLPWIIVIAAPKKAMTQSSVIASNALHALLTLLGVLLIFNVPLAPWPLLHLRPLLVMPYVLIAMWMGYLAGYWYIFVCQYSRFAPRRRQMIRTSGHAVYYPILLAVLVLASALNYRVGNGRSARLADEFADEIVKGLDGRPWLISNGMMDDLVLLSARERHVPVQIINLSRGSASSYLKYIVTLFDDPRLQGLARVGMAPFLNEWMTQTPGIQQQVGVFADADLWTSFGFISVPARVMFVGATNGAVLNAEAIFREHKEFWDTFGQRLIKQAARDRVLGPFYRWVLTHLSKVANNTGVLMEDFGKPGLAWQSYQQARALDANNISALLNAASLAERDSLPEKQKIQQEFKSFMGRLKGQLSIWALGRHYGYVRQPEAFAARGLAWAMSGKPAAGLREIEKAAALGGDTNRLNLVTASVYFMQSMNDRSGELYERSLEALPGNPTALLGLARVKARQGDYAGAQDVLRRLGDAGAPPVLVQLEAATIEILAGHSGTARSLLEKVIEENPRLLRAWSMLALIALAEQDKKTLDKATDVLVANGTRSPLALMTLAQMADARGDRKEARERLEALLAIQPGNVQALEGLVQLDQRESLKPFLEEHVERLLELDPKNALANFALGTIQYTRGDYEMAEASFRICLERNKTSETLNNLAWLLQRKGRDEKALALVTEALAMDSNNASAWDTKAVITMRLGQFDEAQAALERALSLQPGSPHFILHMAQLYEHKGLRAEALRLADPLLANPTEMSLDAYDELRALIKRLRASS